MLALAGVEAAGPLQPPMPLRRELYLNPRALGWSVPDAPRAIAEEVYRFHRRLPAYAPTRLCALDDVAKELGVQAVYIKDESSRLGLPSFKILGASWGAFRALAQRFQLPLDSDLTAVGDAVRSHAPTCTLFAATDGNHGRAVARMGRLLGTPVQILLPKGVHPQTQQLIQDEGAEVTALDVSYDEAVRIAHRRAEASGGVLVQDTAFTGYEEIPQWIVEGYTTMLREIDEQLEGRPVDLVVVPVGVGSLAQAVVAHSEASSHKAAVLAVEPDSAACLWHSLRANQLTPIQTTPTIMTGLDCGTVSSIAWSLLQSGVDASVTISDYEAHEAREYLQSLDISAGPCGAAPLAALRRLSDSERRALGLNRTSTIVLLCTEGMRDYEIPHQSETKTL